VDCVPWRREGQRAALLLLAVMLCVRLQGSSGFDRYVMSAGAEAEARTLAADIVVTMSK
jgi:hypothetical protein